MDPGYCVWLRDYSTGLIAFSQPLRNELLLWRLTPSGEREWLLQLARPGASTIAFDVPNDPQSYLVGLWHGERQLMAFRFDPELTGIIGQKPDDLVGAPEGWDKAYIFSSEHVQAHHGSRLKCTEIRSSSRRPAGMIRRSDIGVAYPLDEEIVIGFSKGEKVGPALRIAGTQNEPRIRIDLFGAGDVIDVHLEGRHATDASVFIAIRHPQNSKPPQVLPPVLLSASNRWGRLAFGAHSRVGVSLAPGHELYFICPDGIPIDGIFLGMNGKRERVNVQLCKYGFGRHQEKRFVRWEKDNERALQRYDALSAEILAAAAKTGRASTADASINILRPNLVDLFDSQNLRFVAELGDLRDKLLEVPIPLAAALVDFADGLRTAADVTPDRLVLAAGEFLDWPAGAVMSLLNRSQWANASQVVSSENAFSMLLARAGMDNDGLSWLKGKSHEQQQCAGIIRGGDDVAQWLLLRRHAVECEGKDIRRFYEALVTANSADWAKLLGHVLPNTELHRRGALAIDALGKALKESPPARRGEDLCRAAELLTQFHQGCVQELVKLKDCRPPEEPYLTRLPGVADTLLRSASAGLAQLDQIGASFGEMSSTPGSLLNQSVVPAALSSGMQPVLRIDAFALLEILRRYADLQTAMAEVVSWLEGTSRCCASPINVSPSILLWPDKASREQLATRASKSVAALKRAASGTPLALHFDSLPSELAQAARDLRSAFDAGLEKIRRAYDATSKGSLLKMLTERQIAHQAAIDLSLLPKATDIRDALALLPTIRDKTIANALWSRAADQIGSIIRRLQDLTILEREALRDGLSGDLREVLQNPSDAKARRALDLLVEVARTVPSAERQAERWKEVVRDLPAEIKTSLGIAETNSDVVNARAEAQNRIAKHGARIVKAFEIKLAGELGEETRLVSILRALGQEPAHSSLTDGPGSQMAVTPVPPLLEHITALQSLHERARAVGERIGAMRSRLQEAANAWLAERSARMLGARGLKVLTRELVAELGLMHQAEIETHLGKLAESLWTHEECIRLYGDAQVHPDGGAANMSPVVNAIIRMHQELARARALASRLEEVQQDGKTARLLAEVRDRATALANLQDEINAEFRRHCDRLLKEWHERMGDADVAISEEVIDRASRFFQRDLSVRTPLSPEVLNLIQARLEQHRASLQPGVSAAIAGAKSDAEVQQRMLALERDRREVEQASFSIEDALRGSHGVSAEVLDTIRGFSRRELEDYRTGFLGPKLKDAQVERSWQLPASVFRDADNAG